MVNDPMHLALGWRTQDEIGAWGDAFVEAPCLCFLNSGLLLFASLWTGLSFLAGECSPQLASIRPAM